MDGILSLWQQPSVLLFLTLAVYALALILRARTGYLLLNPVLISTVTLIAYLKILDIDYAVYHDAAQFIDFWLKPAVVALAVPLYQNRQKIFSQWLPVIVSQLAGSVTGIITGMYFAKWLGAEREVVLSLAAKSVTNPIAIEITRTIGGIPAITAATVIVAGLVGQIAGYTVLKNTVGMPSSVGMSLTRHGHRRLTRTQPAHGSIRRAGADPQRRPDRRHRPDYHPRIRILNTFQTTPMNQKGRLKPKPIATPNKGAAKWQSTSQKKPQTNC